MKLAAGRQPRPPVLSVAPMMERTDRPFRALLRHVTRRTLLYTEMVHAAAIVRGSARHGLVVSPDEHPIALQLGGDDPVQLAEAARIGVDLGYDEVNLNVGCPSERVQSGCFGAVLMKQPARVAVAVSAMRNAVAVPVTVKHRLGVDHQDDAEFLFGFVDQVAAAGCDRFTIHARKAWLSGLSPSENRTVPPLRPAEVWALKAARPQLVVELNGGVVDVSGAVAHLGRVDAVMIGRAFWDDPFRFHDVDSRLFGGTDCGFSRADIANCLVAWAAAHSPGHAHRVARVMLNLFAGQPGARRWRRILSEAALRVNASVGDLGRAVNLALDN